MKMIMNKLMMSCETAARLIEKKQHFPLGVSDKAKLALHVSMCEICKTYQKQSERLHAILKTHALNDAKDLDTKELEKRILETIERGKDNS